jgi:hypothetical protein
VSTSAVAIVVAIVSLAPISAAGQAPQSRTPWGDPDLQGVYTFATLTPMERPRDLAGKAAFTEAELAELQKRQAVNIVTDSEDAPGEISSYNAFWTETEKGRLTGRTSLITDATDGRQPALTSAADNRRERFQADIASRTVGTAPFEHILLNSWADMDEFTRCHSRPMPRIGQSYNHGLQVLQTPGFVVIHYESMHDVRIIPLDGRPHLDKKVDTWNGDSRGRWEGQTLVIESTNFTTKALFADYRGFDGIFKQPTLRLVERLTRVDADTINYEVTVEDPATWTKPWTFLIPWKADDPNYQEPEDLYEYACHEGNYRMMEDALSGSRHLENTPK